MSSKGKPSCRCQQLGYQTVKKASQSSPRKRRIKWNRFRPRRVRGRKHVSGCKCGICLPLADKLCAQQTAKNWRKSPKGFFDKLKNQLSLPTAGLFMDNSGHLLPRDSRRRRDGYCRCSLPGFLRTTRSDRSRGRRQNRNSQIFCGRFYIPRNSRFLPETAL